MPLYPGALEILHSQPKRRVLECFRERETEDFALPPCVIELEEFIAYVVTCLDEITTVPNR